MNFKRYDGCIILILIILRGLYGWYILLIFFIWRVFYIDIGKCLNIKVKIFEFFIYYKLWLMIKNIIFKVLGIIVFGG